MPTVDEARQNFIDAYTHHHERDLADYRWLGALEAFIDAKVAAGPIPEPEPEPEPEFESEPAGAEAEGEEVKKGRLPDDFPGIAALHEAGINTYTQLSKVADLTEIPGIGPATAEKIQAELGAE